MCIVKIVSRKKNVMLRIQTFMFSKSIVFQKHDFFDYLEANRKNKILVGHKVGERWEGKSHKLYNLTLRRIKLSKMKTKKYLSLPTR